MLKSYTLKDANFFTVKIYPGTTFHKNINVSANTTYLETENKAYNSWSVFDWFNVKNKKVAAKLKRFNDIPEISSHPNLSSLELRKLVKNAYHIFFSNISESEIEKCLWEGVLWED